MCGDIRSLPRAPYFPLNHSVAGTEAKAQRLRLCNSSRHSKKSTLKSIETTWVWICTHKSIMILEGVAKKSYRGVTTFLKSCSELPTDRTQKEKTHVRSTSSADSTGSRISPSLFPSFFLQLPQLCSEPSQSVTSTTVLNCAVCLNGQWLSQQLQ